MVSLEGFDARKVEPRAAFKPIPAGKYKAVIEAEETKKTKSGDNAIFLTVQIVDGEHKPRKLFCVLNLWNTGPNAEAAKAIAQGTLSAICKAVGNPTPKSSAELVGHPLVVVVKVEKNKSTGEFQNGIVTFEPTSGPDQGGYKEAIDPAEEGITTAEELDASAPWS